MTKAIALLSVLLAASFVSLAQNRIEKRSPMSCTLSDLSTADGIEARVSSLAVVAAANTCPVPPPPPPTGGQWTFVQEAYAGGWPGGGNCAVWTGSCTAHLPHPVTPGNLLIYLPLTYTGGIPSVLTSVSEEPIVICSQCQTGSAALDYLQLGFGYTLRAVGGEQTATCNVSVPPSGWIGCGVVEAHWSGSGGVTFDAGDSGIAPCSLKCAGINLNLGGSDDFILQVDFPFNTNPLSVSGPYTFFQGSYAYLLNATSGAAPTWFLPQTDPATSNNAIAFTGH